MKYIPQAPLLSGLLATLHILVFCTLCTTKAANGELTATATARVLNGFVVEIVITSGGSGYTAPPAVALSGGGGEGAEAKAIEEWLGN